MSGQPEELNELKDITISALYNGEYNSHSITYEIPIYQRNYAWGEEEISALIQDVYHAFSSDEEKNYYLGTLVSFRKDDQNGVFEVIDGQQRLTTIFLILKSLEVECTNRLTYKARRKANNAIKSLMDGKKKKPDDKDEDKGIWQGFENVESSLEKIALSGEQETKFKDYFQNKVHIIHYQVPKDIDLNHYFEIMNSRGEQLEMSEVLKARLMEKLNEADKAKFSLLWECCSEMNVYVQQKYAKKYVKPDTFGKIFAPAQAIFTLQSFNDLPDVSNSSRESYSIEKILEGKVEEKAKTDAADTGDGDNDNASPPDSPAPKTGSGRNDGDNAFQPLMDFANFLLIVLKLTVKLEKIDLDAKTIVLHDKELLNQFGRIQFNEAFVKKFGYNLLKARFFLDNYIVHHSCEEDTAASNPWKLQYWKKSESKCVNLGSGDTQEQLVHLLSMFEVAFPPRQRKNYLFYCLLYLFENENDYKNLEKFRDFLSKLADKYFWDVYMAGDIAPEENKLPFKNNFEYGPMQVLYFRSKNLNKHNVPLPGSFDNEILASDGDQISLLNLKLENKPDEKTFRKKFADIYGGNPDENTKGQKSKGIPLFIFNYLDYKIWKKYSDLLHEGKKPNDFFPKEFGCTADADADSDLIQKSFEQFYFSRTRRSLEHYYPQAKVNQLPGMDEDQINCFGNFAMIGEEANSSGSNWDPNAKRIRYLDSKISRVSVASLKFMIMMQICKEEGWTAEKINEHQKKMLEILLDSPEQPAENEISIEKSSLQS